VGELAASYNEYRRNSEKAAREVERLEVLYATTENQTAKLGQDAAAARGGGGVIPGRGCAQ
jgi:hypothetical protein